MDRVAESMNKMEKIRQFNLFLVRREIKRQGTYALYDNLYPSRIITGVPEEDEEINRKAGLYVNLVQEGAVKKDIPTFYQPDGSRSSNSTIAIDGYPPPPRFAAPPLLPPKVFQQPLYRTVLHIFDK